MAGKRAVQVVGLGAVGLGGYYLYSAGGSPKVAEKQFEHDATKLGNKISNDLPRLKQEAKTEAKLTAEKAGQQFDKVAAQAKAATNKVDSRLESYRATAEENIDAARKEVVKDASAAVDKFDKNVQQGATKTKGWLSGFF